MTGKRLLLRLVTLLAIAALTVAAGASAKTDGAATPKAPNATLKIGLVTDIGGLNDRSFNHLAYLGLQRRSLRVREVRVRTTAIALFVGIAGLMFSYLVTTGFWMGFTWVFLGLSVGAARLTLESREKTPERQSANRD